MAISKHKILLFILLGLFIIIGYHFYKDKTLKTKINVWYGVKQIFGENGNPQRQINILGNIRSDTPFLRAYFTLNEDSTRYPLTLGCDLHRLAQKGDFNIEIERNKLREGQNKVVISAIHKKRILTSKKVTFKYTAKNKWQLPYKINWSETEKIQDVVEVIDGNWMISDNGIRTQFKYYDRILAFGDNLWKNYEIFTTVIIHDFTPPRKGPPTYNVSHVAIASRWPGHDNDTLQPNRKWYPLGATSEFRMTSDYDSCRWRIFDGENFYKEQDVNQYRTIESEKVYGMKHRVESVSDSETLYSVKLWDFQFPEPESWDFQAIEVNNTKETGSALLIAHNTDVTFGNVVVAPLD